MKRAQQKDSSRLCVTVHSENTVTRMASYMHSGRHGHIVCAICVYCSMIQCAVVNCRVPMPSAQAEDVHTFNTLYSSVATLEEGQSVPEVQHLEEPFVAFAYSYAQV